MTNEQKFIEDCDFILEYGEPEIVEICEKFIHGVKERIASRLLNENPNDFLYSASLNSKIIH